MHMATVRRSLPKSKLPSHALTNAKERLASFHTANAVVIDEYFRLKDEVRAAAQAVGFLERDLRKFVRDLSTFYEEKP